MAGRADLPDFEHEGIGVAIDVEIDQFLRMSGGIALAPELPPRVRPVGDALCGERLLDGLAVHPRQH